MNANIYYLLIAFLPALTYLSIIYLRTNRLVDLRKSLNFFFYGFSSIILIFGILTIFPRLQDYIEFKEYITPSYGFFQRFSLPTPTEWAEVFRNFVQIGLVEELSKFTMFFIGLCLLKRETRPNTLFSYMFYSCIVATGFGMVENFLYFTRFAPYSSEHEMMNLICVRSAFSVVLHLEAGLIIGYFYAVSTVFSSWFKKVGWVVLGLILATIQHGLFNYQLSIFERFTFYGIDIMTASIIIIGLGLCYTMANDLAKRDGDKDKLWSIKKHVFNEGDKS